MIFVLPRNPGMGRTVEIVHRQLRGEMRALVVERFRFRLLHVRSPYPITLNNTRKAGYSVVYLLNYFKMPAFDDKQIGLIFKTLRFAAEKHRSHRRKNAEASPYINHLIEVADLLWDVGRVRDLHLI